MQNPESGRQGGTVEPCRIIDVSAKLPGDSVAGNVVRQPPAYAKALF